MRVPDGERRRTADRRRQTAWSLAYGGLRPRRRTGRRTGDERHIWLDWHEPRVLYLTLAIVLMSCADALFTLNLLAIGAEELNSVMRVLLDKGSHWFLWGKIGLTSVSAVVLAVAARRYVLGHVPVIALIKLCLLGYAVLIAWELYLLYWLMTDGGQTDLLLLEWVAG